MCSKTEDSDRSYQSIRVEHLALCQPRNGVTPAGTLRFLKWTSGGFRASGADDLIGGTENLLGALFGYRLAFKTAPTAQPILNISATESGALKAQRFAAQQRHGLRFNLSQSARRRLTVRKICLGTMAQNDVSLCFAIHKPTYVVFVVMWC